MFLSRITIPPVSAYEVHQHLHRYFDDQERKFLFRRMSDTELLMLSIVKPKAPFTTLDIDSIPCGRPISFSADLIITKSTSARGRIDLRDHFGRRDWLKRKLSGAASLRFARFEDGWLQLQTRARLIVAQTTGVIEITDRARFVRLLQAGIGRNKAYGCGLIWMPEIMTWTAS